MIRQVLSAGIAALCVMAGGLKRLLMCGVAACVMVGCETVQIPTEGIPPWGTVEDVRQYLATCEKQGKQSPGCIAYKQNIAARKAAYEAAEAQKAENIRMAPIRQQAANPERWDAIVKGPGRALGRRLEEIKRENWRVYNDVTAMIRTQEAWSAAFGVVNDQLVQCLNEGHQLRSARSGLECEAAFNFSMQVVQNFDWQSPPGGR